MFFEAFGQRRNFAFTKVAAWLERVVVNFVDVQPQQIRIGLWLRDGWRLELCRRLVLRFEHLIYSVLVGTGERDIPVFRCAEQGGQATSQATVFTHVPGPPYRVLYKHEHLVLAVHSRSPICHGWEPPRQLRRAG